MRSYLAAAASFALVVLTLEPIAWGQQQQPSNRAQNLSVLGATGGTGLGAQSGTSGGVGQFEAPETLRSGEFVGVDRSDIQRAMQATGAQRQGGQAGQPFSPNAFSRALQAFTGQGRGFSTRRTTGEIRTRLRAAFTITRPAPAQLGTRLAGRLHRPSWLQAPSPVKVSIEGETAILRGVVATEHDRLLAERVARLEPGVRRVDNQLTVGPAPEPTVE